MGTDLLQQSLLIARPETLRTDMSNEGEDIKGNFEPSGKAVRSRCKSGELIVVEGASLVPIQVVVLELMKSFAKTRLKSQGESGSCGDAR